MKHQHQADEALKCFCGHAPLFPLPNGVLFPHLVLPLHIFEERYRQMAADALAGDRLIAMAVLRPGWECRYQSKSAPIYSTVCLGVIVQEERLDDGRYNLLLRGVSRAQLLAERAGDEPYRVAQLLPVRDRYPVRSTEYWRACRKAVLAAFLQRFPRLVEDTQLQTAIRNDLSLGALCDLLSQSIDLSPTEAARLLTELDVGRRCEWILERLLLDCHESGTEDASVETFPPTFSMN